MLSIVAGIQSIALFALSSVADDLDNKTKASDTTGAGALGAVAAFTMFVASAFVLAKPKVARVLFAVAAVLFIPAAAAGFSDAWIWTGASVLLALASWRSVGELERKRENDRAELRADFVASLQKAQIEN